MLDVSLLPKQWEVFQPVNGVDYDAALYQGGYGSGKTFLGSLLGLMTLCENHDSAWLVASDTGVRLSLTTVQTYKDLLGDAEIDFRYNKTDKVLTIPDWGGKVIFKGLEDPDALRGVNAIGCHIEEASLIEESAYLAILSRLRQSTGKSIRVVLTTNPQSTRGWLYDHFVERSGITTEDMRGSKVKISRRRVIASTLENKHVSDAYIAMLKASYDDDLYRIMVEGLDGDYAKGLVCKSWTDANIMETPYRPELRLYLSCDFNIDPNSWVVFHRFNNEFHFIDEIVLENSTTVQSTEEFFRRYGAHDKGVIVTGDASGDNRSTQAKTALDTNYTTIRSRLSELGMRHVMIDIKQSNPPVSDRTAAWNRAVCDSNGVRRVFVDPKCQHLIDNCRNLKYVEGSNVIFEPTIKMIERSPKLKFTKHVWDAASYPVEKYDPITLHQPEELAKRQQVYDVPFQPNYYA